MLGRWCAVGRDRDVYRTVLGTTRDSNAQAKVGRAGRKNLGEREKVWQRGENMVQWAQGVQVTWHSYSLGFI